MTVTRGDIFYVDLGDPVGSEQGGLRPFLILQNNMRNRFGATTIGVPITSKTKRDLPVYAPINGLPRPSLALCNQIRVIDKSRIRRRVGRAEQGTIKQVEAALRASVGI